MSTYTRKETNGLTVAYVLNVKITQVCIDYFYTWTYIFFFFFRINSKILFVISTVIIFFKCAKLFSEKIQAADEKKKPKYILCTAKVLWVTVLSRKFESQNMQRNFI